LTLDVWRAVSLTRASFKPAGIRTRMPVRFSDLLAVKLLAKYHASASSRNWRRTRSIRWTTVIHAIAARM